MSFGKQMRLRREELHLSRAALAEELGVSPSAISNYENGVSSPKIVRPSPAISTTSD